MPSEPRLTLPKPEPGTLTIHLIPPSGRQGIKVARGVNGINCSIRSHSRTAHDVVEIRLKSPADATGLSRTQGDRHRCEIAGNTLRVEDLDVRYTGGRRFRDVGGDQRIAPAGQRRRDARNFDVAGALYRSETRALDQYPAAARRSRARQAGYGGLSHSCSCDEQEQA